MTTFGRNILLPSSGIPVMVSADGSPEWKTGGITIDWSTVTAVGADTPLADGLVIPNGQKGLQFGTVLCQITATGLYGPYAAGAADGRQTLTRDAVFILNESVLQNGPLGLAVGRATDNPAVLYGGRVWGTRLGVGGAGQPTLAALLAVMPRLVVVHQ